MSLYANSPYPADRPPPKFSEFYPWWSRTPPIDDEVGGR